MSRRISYALLAFALFPPGLVQADAETDRKILNTLIASLRSEDPSVRISAAREIGHMGAEGAPALRSLSTLLRDENASVQNAATRALKQITKDTEASLAKTALNVEDFVPALRDIVEDDKGMFNKTAAQVLDQAVAALAHELPKASAEARELIVQRLGEAGERGADMLRKLAKSDPSPEVRQMAKDVVAKLEAASTTG